VKLIKVSAKCARLKFLGCIPEYIASTCKGACCRRSGKKMALISIDTSEESAIKAFGVEVADGLIAGTSDFRCDFQNRTTELCDLHGTEYKPLGCIASPFTLNKKRTLIVRHRYTALRCYNAGQRIPAYIAFRASLDALLGEQQAQTLHDHLEQGGGDKWVPIEDRTFNLLKDNDFKRKVVVEKCHQG